MVGGASPTGNFFSVLWNFFIRVTRPVHNAGEHGLLHIGYLWVIDSLDLLAAFSNHDHLVDINVLKYLSRPARRPVDLQSFNTRRVAESDCLFHPINGSPVPNCGKHPYVLSALTQ